MNTAERRAEIINILLLRRQTTLYEMSVEFGVTKRTIQNDIRNLSGKYPIITKQGGNGGIFLEGAYRPYANTLSKSSQETIFTMYKASIGAERDALKEVLVKYGSSDIDI